MRVSICRGLGLALLGSLTVACGDKSSNPDAVTVDELKYPGNLVIADHGDGAVTLSWAGANNEDAFDGYNVYGVQDSPDSIGLKEGQAIELLDSSGNKDPNAEGTLAKFNYDPTKKLGAAASLKLADTATTSKDAPQFSALPIFRFDTDGTTKLLPTCKAQAGTCALTTAANKDATAGDNPAYAVNGRVSFDVPDTLTVGKPYCFLVLASEKNGEKVSQTSSNLACVTPKYKLEMNLPLAADATHPRLFDLRAILTACNTAGKCDATAAAANVGEAPASGRASGDTTQHIASDPGPVYIEKSASGVMGLIAGDATAINDVGAYKDGLDDATLPATPVLVQDDTKAGTAGGINKDAPIFNQGGYSVPGQTVPLQANHVYVIAVGAPGATVAGPYNYHWLYVAADPTTGATVAVKMRLTKAAQ